MFSGSYYCKNSGYGVMPQQPPLNAPMTAQYGNPMGGLLIFYCLFI